MGDFEKKKELFLEQKKTLDTFLKTGAISRMQYDKSYGDLIKKMGMESVTEELKTQNREEQEEELDDDIKGQCFQIHQRQIYGRS